MTNEQTTLRSFWPKHVSWPTIVFAILAIGTFFVIFYSHTPYVLPIPMGSGVMEKSGSTGAMPPTVTSEPARDSGGANAPVQNYDMYYPYPNPDVPVTDKREFLKVYYNASMRTRDVPGLTRRVETTVRGYDGRIDQESNSQRYGYVSFALPQSKYAAFRAELESLAGSRFLTVNVSSQNLLPQKLSIEEQQKQADAALLDYKAARQKTVNAHASAVQYLQTNISADEQQLAVLRAKTQTPEILAQIQIVSDDLASLKKQLAGENAAYALQLDLADRNIKSAQDWQKAVHTQDQALLDNVATVVGNVSIQWISLWETILLYLPGYWIPSIFAALAFISFLRDRRRFGTV